MAGLGLAMSLFSQKLIDVFFRAAWEFGLDLGDSNVIEDLLVQNGFNKDELMNKISSKEVKLELILNRKFWVNKRVICFIQKYKLKNIYQIFIFIIYYKISKF